MKQRMLSFMLALALLCGMLPTILLPVGAEKSGADALPKAITSYENAIQELPEPYVLPFDSGIGSRKPMRGTGEDWVCEINVLNIVEARLVEKIREGETTLDISELRISPESINLNSLVHYCPYIGNGIDLNCYTSGDGYYSQIDISCPMNKSELNDYLTQVDARIAEVDELLSTVSYADQKALLLHDYLVYNCEYDYENLCAGTVPDDSYRSAGILMNRTGVCQGYAYAFMYFMNRQHIECHVIESDIMNHAWNMIKLGDEYYHVDVTWDDPVRDDLGMVRHDYFLLSDRAISGIRGNGSEVHEKWVTPYITCDSTEYDNAYWYGVSSPIFFSGDYRYFCRDNNLVKLDSTTGLEYTLQSFGTWPVWGSSSSYWIGSYTGLWLEDNKIYYNSPTEIRAFDLNTLSDNAVYCPDTSSGYIFGSAVIDGMMHYELKQNPNNAGTRYSVALADLNDHSGEHIHSYTTSVTAPTCTEKGYTTHTCTCGESNIDSYTSALGHDVVTDKAVAATCTKTGLTQGSHCARCKEVLTKQEVVAALGHAWDAGVITVQPTATEKGVRTYTCLRCSATKTESVPELIHEHSYTVVVTAPTCTEKGYTTHTCSCGDSYIDSYTNALGHNVITDKAAAATCTETGLTQGSHCARCKKVLTKQEVVPALGHAWDAGVITVQPTATEKGIKTYTCTRCSATKTESVPELIHEHSYTAVLTEPNCTEKGYTTHTCTCGDSYKDTYTNALGHSFVNGVCTRCSAKDPNYVPPVKPDIEFTDVKTTDWYYNAVNFAVSNGLFNGMTATTFEPNTAMNRAMLVTVLWRYEGSPKEGTNTFADVKAGQWYTDAVAWASSNNIVGGVGEGRFDPNGNVTREQLAAILFRYCDYKDIGNDGRGNLSAFPDKAKVSSWATNAYSWAVGEGLIGGNKIGGQTLLDPQGNATRAQVATILMRFIQNIAK